MKIYYLQEPNSWKPMLGTCVTKLENITKLVYHLRNKPTNINFNMKYDNWDKEGVVSFKDGDTDFRWDIRTMYIYDKPE
jgi:hypothetical protein